jgi:homoprotocatechuate degradation regulator HpaR
MAKNGREDEMARRADGTPPDPSEIGDRIYEGSLIIELLRLRDSMRLFFRPALRAHGLTDQSWRIVKVLGERGPLEMTSLGVAAVIPMASASRIVTRMARGGVVKRLPNKVDRRQVLVELTAKGRRLHADVAPQIRQVYAELGEKLAPDALEQLHDVVSQLNGQLAALGADATSASED